MILCAEERKGRWPVPLHIWQHQDAVHHRDAGEASGKGSNRSLTHMATICSINKAVEERWRQWTKRSSWVSLSFTSTASSFKGLYFTLGLLPSHIYPGLNWSHSANCLFVTSADSVWKRLNRWGKVLILTNSVRELNFWKGMRHHLFISSF